MPKLFIVSLFYQFRGGTWKLLLGVESLTILVQWSNVTYWLLNWFLKLESLDVYYRTSIFSVAVAFHTFFFILPCLNLLGSQRLCTYFLLFTELLLGRFFLFQWKNACIASRVFVLLKSFLQCFYSFLMVMVRGISYVYNSDFWVYSLLGSLIWNSS